jgi:hypothetical protein
LITALLVFKRQNIIRLSACMAAAPS